MIVRIKSHVYLWRVYLKMIEIVKGYVQSKIEFDGSGYIVEKKKYKTVCMENNFYLAIVPQGWMLRDRGDVLRYLHEHRIDVSGSTRVFWINKSQCDFIKNNYGCKYDCDPCERKCEFFEEG